MGGVVRRWEVRPSPRTRLARPGLAPAFAASRASYVDAATPPGPDRPLADDRSEKEYSDARAPGSARLRGKWRRRGGNRSDTSVAPPDLGCWALLVGDALRREQRPPVALLTNYRRRGSDWMVNHPRRAMPPTPPTAPTPP